MFRSLQSCGVPAVESNAPWLPSKGIAGAVSGGHQVSVVPLTCLTRLTGQSTTVATQRQILTLNVIVCVPAHTNLINPGRNLSKGSLVARLV